VLLQAALASQTKTKTKTKTEYELEREPARDGTASNLRSK